MYSFVDDSGVQCCYEDFNNFTCGLLPSGRKIRAARYYLAHKLGNYLGSLRAPLQTRATAEVTLRNADRAKPFEPAFSIRNDCLPLGLTS